MSSRSSPNATAKAKPSAASIANDEIARFSGHAEDWWNPDGKFKPLHRLNPLRLTYVRDRICAHSGRDATMRASLDGLTILDIGCGGGLMAEPLARLGARVTGLDGSDATITIARQHAKKMGLAINYQTTSAEDMALKSIRYDVVIALEVVEHVADIGSFLTAVASLLKPGGLLIMSTLNRTPKSFVLGIVAAEYVLGWVPRGTHQWTKFIRPSELVAQLRGQGLNPFDMTGLIFNPLQNAFELRSDDLDVNYMLAATKD